MISRRASLLIACALLGLTAQANADGVVRDSVGAISSGRGGTNFAFADNPSILLNNPAGMMNMSGSGMFGVGGALLVTDLDYTDPQNDNANAKFRPFGMPEIAFMRKSEDGWWAAGVGIYAPAGFGAEWRMTSPPFGQSTYKSLGALAKIIPGAAVRLTDRLSVGGTVGLAVSQAELEGPFFIQTGPLSGTPTLLDLQATDVAPTWGFGLQYKLSDRTVLGAAYTSETRFRMDGTANVQAFLGPVVIPSRFDAEVDLVWPRSFGGGISHLIDERNRVSCDLNWTDWSQAFNQLDIQFTNPTNPLFLLFGPEISDTLPMKWKDTFSVRLGYEHFLTPTDVLRTGYIYQTQPIPASTLTPYIPAILQHTFSAGYGKMWGTNSIDFAYQFAFSPVVQETTSDIVGGDFAGSSFKSQAHWLFLTYTKRF